MGSIVLLDDLTINKIAAGEVIERPASAIKELVENSIDAGATNITVEIKNGGISYIRVTDNGKGIMPDDMELAFERHATSKIRVAEDLEKVKSMGFRGEALASIAAISKVNMQSKTEEQEIGYSITVEGGNVIDKSEVGCQKGTIIEVENLFFNTPVRYKFLKKDFTEAGYIEDTITRIALAHPEISIKLINSGKTVISTTGNNDMTSVIYSIYGKDIAENILEVYYEFEDIKITGVIGKPEIARANRLNQIFFVNKRYVKDKTLTASADQAFREKVPSGKFGFLVLNIDMDPAKVDVNVHPAKLEVRFQNEQDIFKAVYHAIKDEFAKDSQIQNMDELEKQNETIEGYNFDNKLIEKENNSLAVVEQKGLLKKFFGRKNEEKNDNITLVEQIYEARKNGTDRHEEINNEYTQVFKEEKNEFVQPKEDNKVEELKFEETKQEEVQTNYKNQVAEVRSEETKYEGMNLEEKSAEVMKKLQELQNLQYALKNGATDIKLENFENKEENKIDEVVEKVENDNNEYKQEEPQLNYEEQVQEENTFEKPEEANKADEEAEIVENNNEEYKQEEPNDFSKVEQDTVTIENNKNIESTYNNLDETIVISEDMKDEITRKLNNEETQVVDSAEIVNHELKLREEPEEENEVYSNINSGAEKIQNLGEKFEAEFQDMYNSIFGIRPKADREVKENEEKYKLPEAEITACENVSLFNEVEEENYISNYKIIGTAFSKYIIVEIEKDIYIVDEKAASERIIYEALKQNFYNTEEKDSQLMLLPDIIELTSKEMDIARENIDIFEKSGFALEEFGENTIKLMGVPSICLELNTKDLFVDILNQINKVPMTAKEEVEERFIATLAKNIANSSEMAYEENDVNSLIQNLLSLKEPFMSNDLKPIAVKMTRTDIEKKFSRR